MKSRHHNNRPVELPNFCHLGVSLRIALTAEAALVASVAARAPDIEAFWAEFIVLSAWTQPALLLTVLALCVASRWLRGRRVSCAGWRRWRTRLACTRLQRSAGLP